MSRKSRQKKGRTLLQKIPPVSVCVFLLIAGLWMGVIFSLMPWINQPALLEDTIPLSVTMQKVEGDYDYRRRQGYDLDEILIYYSDENLVYLPDMKSLCIPSVLSSETLLDKLTAYPAGTLFDAHVEPDGRSIIALSVEGTEIIVYEDACRSIRTNNILFVPLGLFMLATAGYAIWALVIHRRYRRLNAC